MLYKGNQINGVENRGRVRDDGLVITAAKRRMSALFQRGAMYADTVTSASFGRKASGDEHCSRRCGDGHTAWPKPKGRSVDGGSRAVAVESERAAQRENRTDGTR